MNNKGYFLHYTGHCRIDKSLTYIPNLKNCLEAIYEQHKLYTTEEAEDVLRLMSNILEMYQNILANTKVLPK